MRGGKSGWGLSEAADGLPLAFLSADAHAAWREAQPKGLRGWAQASRFMAREGEILALPGPDGGLAGAIAGLGEADPADPLTYARLPGLLPAARFATEAALETEAAMALALGWALGTYGAAPNVQPATLAWPMDRRRERLEPLIAAELDARAWINAPPAELGPTDLAALARAELEPLGAQVRVLAGGELAAGYPGLAHVGRGGVRPPVLIDAAWGPADAPRVTLVGKGVCFDAGGLNAKPWPDILSMRADMAGAAHALALARLIMTRGLAMRLRLLIPAADNMPSGAAMMNGDLVRTPSGQAIEIVHTDYEGRVLLADAMAAADAEAPDLLIDFTTLTDTGLGPDIAGFFTPQDALADELSAAARLARDAVWRLPLWTRYEGQIRTRQGHLANREADGANIGSLAAALFLKNFVRHAAGWLHFDIEGWNSLAGSPRPMGGNVLGLRAVFALLEARYG